MPDTLYHYCSTQSFLHIIETGEVQLSSLSLTNDTLEGQIVANVIDSLAERDGLDRGSRERLQGYVRFDQVVEGLGFCLSEAGDLLSQWRGYAADAAGVSIGFSAEYPGWLAAESKSLTAWGLGLVQVKYEPAEHVAEIEPVYREIKKLIDQGAFRFAGSLLDTPEEIEQKNAELARVRSRLFATTFALFPKLYILKSGAFREELEWRLLSHRAISGTSDSTDPGVSFRTSQNRLIAYRGFKLAPNPSHKAITEVKLGPKHPTPPHMIGAFLEQRGFTGVDVRRSTASYR